ncbi:MAG: DUF547 domain-containing protein [Pseudohongiellaceae bacterium]
MFNVLRVILLAWGLLQSQVILAGFDHGQWHSLLQANIVELRDGKATQVDYDGMRAERASLGEYLHSLAQIPRPEFDGWNEDEQLAFLINAYNAWTVEFILTEYPELTSIKDLGSFFNSPWSQEIVSLFGEKFSLDDVEHEMIRGWGRYNEPRIHFAVNCAAIGCPALANTAFTGENLEELLEKNTRRFMADTERNYFANGRFYLSKIFDWYEEDFEKGWQGYSSLKQFVEAYQSEMQLSSEAVDVLSNGRFRVRYTSYDWGLNRTP